MMIPVGVVFTASRRGLVACDVTCENCSCEYVYLLRKSVASASTASPVTPGGSAGRARVDAQKRLERELLQGNNPAPCPNCGFIQSDMIKRIKSRRSTLPIVLLFVSALIGLICFEMSRTPTGLGSPQVFIPAIGLAISLPWLAWVRLTDLNRNAKDRLQLDLIDRYDAVLRETYEADANSIWGPAILSQDGPLLQVDCDRLGFPSDVCCVCAQSTGPMISLREIFPKIGHQPGMPSQSRIPVPWHFPVCAACVEQTKLRRRSWIGTRTLGSIILAAALIASGYLIATPEMMDAPGDMGPRGLLVFSITMAGIICLLVGPIFSWALSCEKAAPVRFKWMDTNKGMGRLRFLSASYPSVLEKFNENLDPPKVPRRRSIS